MSRYKELCEKYKKTEGYYYEALKLNIVIYLEQWKRESECDNKTLATLLNISESKLIRILKGECNLSLKDIARICHYTGLNLGIERYGKDSSMS